jgi:para-aminobenzoate synthetase component 1
LNTSKYFSLNALNVDLFKQKVLCWLKQYNTFTYLDNNHYSNVPNRYELLVGVDVVRSFSVTELQLPENKGQWMFGHLSYDYKEQLFTKLTSSHSRKDTFPITQFYIPKIVIAIPFQSSQVEIIAASDHDIIFNAILFCEVEEDASLNFKIEVEWQEDMNQQQYINAVKAIQNHIKEGDCYELNLCNGYEMHRVNVDPFKVFKKLNKINPAPFAAFYKYDNNFLLSSSPERYLYKAKSLLVSQPIKGTIKKGATWNEDEQLKLQLKNNIKECAENLMITDLVRNDLARICKLGSVKVPDLLGLYTFNSLHHLISTIQGEVIETYSLKEILSIPFPMGSMTGAPKYIVMELIDKYELSSRGIYSGSIIYITPEGDLDSNVVIRSIVYNSVTKKLHFHSGGAITIDSDPEKEWDEICLKSQRLMDVLKS